MTATTAELTVSMDRLATAANADGEARLHARGWTGSLTLVFDETPHRLAVADGVFSEGIPTEGSAEDLHVICRGSGELWAQILRSVPPPGLTDVLGAAYSGMTVEPASFGADRQLGVRRVVELLRHLVNGTDPTPVPVADGKPHGTFEAAVGRYVHLDVDGVSNRVYFEEAGSGLPLLCQHTAGADGRQWRHLLADERITSRFRVIAYDLPYHGRSLPPSGTTWWAERYLLTRDRLMPIPLALSEVLGLDRPAFVGSSVGGMLALDLARFHPDRFRAVIACEAALHIAPADDRPVQSRTESEDPAKHAALMMSSMGATAPEGYRQETRLHYAQGAPGVFTGDINYFIGDHDLRGQAHLIDTETCPVHMLTGEYDFRTVAAAEEAAEAIPGVTHTVMTGLGHFPMSEDPHRFAEYLLPVLDRIAELG
jgi:pimeloyl-ACP methyl ester carboxylesterase